MTALALSSAHLPDVYEPAKALETIAIAEAAEKHFARARDVTKLFEAITEKLSGQADYVVWRDGVVVPSRKDPKLRGKRSGDCSSEIPALPAADPGAVTAHRWRKDFAKKSMVLLISTSKNSHMKSRLRNAAASRFASGAMAPCKIPAIHNGSHRARSARRRVPCLVRSISTLHQARQQMKSCARPNSSRKRMTASSSHGAARFG